jgi:DNA-binding CsgD family transcriptional regulator
MQQELDKFLESLNQAETYGAAWKATHDFFKRHGFDHLMHAYGHAAADAVRVTEIREDWIPRDWRAELESHANDRNNPVTRHLATRLTPLVGGIDFVDRQRDGEKFWRFIQETSAPWGIRSGFMLPLRYKIDRGLGAFIAMTRMKGTEFTRYFSEKDLMLRLAAHYADQKLVALTMREKAEAVRLSPRERECLLWLSQGLRNDRIAERMGISNPTVELHLANARRKLKAATREQALARAISLGLVTP